MAFWSSMNWRRCFSVEPESSQPIGSETWGSFTLTDESGVKSLFLEFLEATRLTNAKSGEVRRSSVSVAKALHLLAPSFFPLWDDEIAKRYGCGWPSATGAADCYITFMKQAKDILASLGDEEERQGIERRLSERARFPKPLLKFVDEYNYAHFTKGWV